MSTATDTHVRPFTKRHDRPRAFSVRDPLTGEVRYFASRDSASCYAARLEIAEADAALDLE